VSGGATRGIIGFMPDHQHVAFYYPGVIWRDPNWVKSLALFFDEIALLVPDYMRDRPQLLDPSIVAGLEEAGLLRILSPESLVDDEAAERLASTLGDIIASGALDELPHAGPFQELSWSRMGGLGDPELAQMIFEELHQRGLARQSEDGASIPLHPLVRISSSCCSPRSCARVGPALDLSCPQQPTAPGYKRLSYSFLGSPPQNRRQPG
jgi:hypothetical protein